MILSVGMSLVQWGLADEVNVSEKIEVAWIQHEQATKQLAYPNGHPLSRGHQRRVWSKHESEPERPASR